MAVREYKIIEKEGARQHEAMQIYIDSVVAKSLDSHVRFASLHRRRRIYRAMEAEASEDV